MQQILIIIFTFQVITQQKIWATYLMKTRFLATSKITQFKNSTQKQKFTIKARRDSTAYRLIGLSYGY